MLLVANPGQEYPNNTGEGRGVELQLAEGLLLGVNLQEEMKTGREGERAGGGSVSWISKTSVANLGSEG